MKRAEWRRQLSNERKYKNIGPLASNTRPLYAITQAQIDDIKADAINEIIRQYGNVGKAAVELEKSQSYDKGYDDGFEFAKDHFLTLQYICMGLAMKKLYGFAAKRILNVWSATNEIYGEIVDRQNNGEDLDVLETEYNWKLFQATGLRMDLDGYGEMDTVDQV